LFSILKLYLHQIFIYLGQGKSLIRIVDIRAVESIGNTTRGVSINKTIAIVSAGTLLVRFTVTRQECDHYPRGNDCYGKRQEDPVIHLYFIDIFL